MIKFLFAGRRAPGRTRQAAQKHLLQQHGRLVVRPPAGSGPMPADYVQNHVLDGAYPAGSGDHAIERDLLTELWFEDMAHMQASVATAYYRNVLRPDEPRFVDDATVVKMRVMPIEWLVGERARYKVAWLVTLGARGEAVDSGKLVAKLVDRGFTRIVGNGVAAGSFVENVVEAWHDDLAAARGALDADAWPFDDDIDLQRSLALVMEEFPAARLRTMFA